MLVLSRRTKETILIGDEIEIHVIEARHGRVRLGIQAPQTIRILRSELAVSQGVSIIYDTPIEANVNMPAASVVPCCPR